MGLIKNSAKVGFGAGIGIMGAQILFILLGLLFFIPGVILLKTTENDKESKGASYYGGLVLMLLGVVIMGGLGFGYLMDSLDF